MTDTITYAKAYIREGWDVFPLRARDKIPAVKWADVATKEENMAVGWWDNQPNANIGVACGRRSGIVVLDVDGEHGGYESLQLLQEQYGRLPETKVVKTGGGGEHIYFAHPGVEIRNSTGRLGPGLDIRGDGGYVVSPPSVHPNGRLYEWAVSKGVPLAPFPEWMIELLRDTPQESIPVATGGKIVNGKRNDTLTRMAGAMRRKGFDEDGIYLALKDHNDKYCLPPLSDGEVLLIARSISRYQPVVEKVEVPKNSLDVLDELEADIIERQRNPVDVWGIHYAWPFISHVTGGKQRGELTILGGEPKVGKSWWALQDAMTTAVGDGKLIRPTPTLIWSGEMTSKQVLRRMVEMMGVPKRHMKKGTMSETDWQFFREAKAILANSPLYVKDNPLDLDGLKKMLEYEVTEHGVEHVLLDYDWLISARGDGEIETSQAISRACKILATDLNLSIMLVSSVNKSGMDTTSVSKTVLSGSGKKIHDADNVFLLTKAPDGTEQSVPVDQSWRVVTLTIAAGREIDHEAGNGSINYIRDTPNPRFREARQDRIIPKWIEPIDHTV